MSNSFVQVAANLWSWCENNNIAAASLSFTIKPNDSDTFSRLRASLEKEFGRLTYPAKESLRLYDNFAVHGVKFFIEEPK